MKFTIKNTKWLTMLTTMAMVFSLCPIIGSAAEEPFTTTASIINASFEEPIADGAVPGWEQVHKAPESEAHLAYYEISDIVRPGSTGKSLKLVDQSGAHQVTLQSAPIEVLPGESYSATSWFYTSSTIGRGSIMVRFFKNDVNQQTGSDQIFHVQNQSDLKQVWTQISTPGAIAPVDAKYMRIYVYVSSAWLSPATHFDDVTATGRFPVPRAADDLTLTGGAVSFVNSNFEVTVGASNASFLYASDIKVNYDPTKFEYLSTEMIEGYANATSNTIIDNETIRITSTLTGSQAPLHGDVPMFKLIFRALDKTNGATFTIDQTSELARQNADESQNVDHPLTAASLSVEVKASAADVNNDDKVDLIDLTLVARQIGATIGPDNEAYDLNLDEVIDIADLAIVSQVILAEGVE